MKQVVIISIVILLVLFILIDKKSENNSHITETYPWQVSILADGKSRVFGVVLGETPLKDVDVTLKAVPKMALYSSNEKLSLEAYYKNVSLGGLIGSFIFTLNASEQQLEQIRKESIKKQRVENNGTRYELDKLVADKVKIYTVKNLIYIPTVNLDEKTIEQRFGKPAYKIKLKTKEVGWHYLYPEKGLDLIYKEEGKEILQYVLPKNFNELLGPLQDH